MALKYFLLALVALFALQGISEAKSTLDIETYALSDTIKELISKIIALVRDAVSTTTAQLKVIIDQLLASGKIIIEKAHNTVKDLVTSVLGDINKLIGQAEDLGCDITDCLGKNMETLENIPIAILNELTTCVDNEIQKAYNIIDDTIELINSILDEVTVLEKEFVACKGGIICMTQVVGKATLVLAKLPLRLVDISAKAVKLINGLSFNITVCSTTTVAGTIANVTELAQGITKCIIGKINEVVTTIVSV